MATGGHNTEFVYMVRKGGKRYPCLPSYAKEKGLEFRVEIVVGLNNSSERGWII